MGAQSRTRDRGAAAVEFALIVPVLVLLAFGIAELGRAFHLQSMLSGAAREGVRVMALQNSPSAARDRVRSYASTVTLTDSQIAVTPTSCPAGATTTGTTATVTVTYPTDLFFGSFNAKLDVVGKASMRCRG